MSAIFGKNTLDFPRMRSDVRRPTSPWQWNLGFFPFLHNYAVICMLFHFFYSKILILHDFCDFCDPNFVRGDPGADSRKYAISRFLTFFLFSLLLSNRGRLSRKMLLDRREQSIRWSHAYFFCLSWRSQSFFRNFQVFAIPEFCCVLLWVFVRACKRLFLVLEYANNNHVRSTFDFLDFLNAVARVLLW